MNGHFHMTNRAVVELQQDCLDHPLVTNLKLARLGSASAARDAYDGIAPDRLPVVGFLLKKLYTPETHWSDAGQKHHFMRAKNQTRESAWRESVEWIRANTEQTIQLLVKLLPMYFNKDTSDTWTPTPSCYLPTMYASPRPQWDIQRHSGQFDEGSLWQRTGWPKLGSAIHAVQDSFSSAHVLREKATDEDQPGDIILLHVYDMHNKKTHGHKDSEWHQPRGEDEDYKLSETGRLAVNASKELLLIVLECAIYRHRGIDRFVSKWDAYQRTWLNISPIVAMDMRQHQSTAAFQA